MRGNIEARLRALEEGTPGGYRTFDDDGNVVISSALPAGDWFAAALELLRSKGRRAEKEALRAALERSSGPDNTRGRLYEMVAALDVAIEE